MFKKQTEGIQYPGKLTSVTFPALETLDNTVVYVPDGYVYAETEDNGHHKKQKFLLKKNAAYSPSMFQ